MAAAKPFKTMKTNIGLWIDHRQAVIVRPSDEGEEVKVILSHVDRHPGRTDGEPSTEAYEAQLVQADDVRERKLTQDLNTYYDEVIAYVHEADSLLIFGPGEAKEELDKRLAQEKPTGRTIKLETTDKMTERQITTKVRDCFKKKSPVIQL